MENKDRADMLEQELKKVKDELEIQTWGLNKTNDAIKLLYKDLEEKNARLQELDRLKSDFIATVSHELRTPLSISREGISIVLDQISGTINDNQRRVLTTARDNIDRLSRIIDNLLDISKIESGKVKLKKDSVDIITLVKQTTASLESKIKQRGLELRTVFGAASVTANVDADKIIQVFTNLIANAVKFTEKGYIEVSVIDKGHEVECRVRDTGAGIAKEDLPKVFGRFEQFGRVAGPGEKGTGLGLAIVKGIIDMHKGRIQIESKLGEGTTFTFVLPKDTAREV